MKKSSPKTPRANRKQAAPKPANVLMVRLDEDSKQSLVEAAELRRISISDYVRTVTVPQARREVRGARERVIVLTADEQLALWQALHEPVKLTAAQRKLSAIMRGEA
jgi:uncharacterized protein (DUF1778 family)